jgi:transcriptional regulator with XRE-family HTH domain
VNRGLRTYRGAQGLSQVQLAQILGVSQAYVSQLESGARPVSKKLAVRLAALPTPEHLPPTVFPEEWPDLEADDQALASDLAALGYPGFSRAPDRAPRNPAAVIISILRRRQVAPAVMAAVPWVLLAFPDLNARWLIDRARLHNLQNRLGFLTDLALALAASPRAAGRYDDAHLSCLAEMRTELEDSRLVKEDTLARVLTPAERQFFLEHRSDTARHWNLLTGLTKEQLAYAFRD